jgi:S1-C subfamily serine protease
MTIQSGNASTAPGAAPRQGKSHVGLILGCVALFFLGFIGFCVVSTCGLAILGGSITRTPTVAAQAIATTPIVQKSFTPAIVQAIATTPIVQKSFTPAIQTPAVKQLPTQTTTSVSVSNPLRTALLGSVYVLTPDDSGKSLGAGSGTILTPQGHILTNFHVIGDVDTGKFENKQGLVYIGISPPEMNAKPIITYLAKILKSDRSLDLALLRIVALRDGKPLPADLKLTPVPVGDSDKVQIGDEVTVIGFPSLGDGTVTLTRGAVSGLLNDTESVGTWFKTDAEINPGNSGGIAINSSEFLRQLTSTPIL